MVTRLRFNRLLPLTLSTMVLLSFATTTPAVEIKPFTANYQIERGGDVVGDATISLHPIGGDKWRYVTASNAHVLFFSFRDSETSIVRFENDTVIPLSFVREKIYPTKTNRTEQQFDWLKKIETGNKDGNKHWTVTLEDGVQERHNHSLLLRRDLKNGAKQLQYRISDSGKIGDYKYLVSGEEKIQTPAGIFDSIKVERDRDVARQTIIWYAPSLDFIPVKLRQIEDGKIQAEMQLIKLEM